MILTSLNASAAGFRLAGYMIETQLRVAQVLTEAAIEANPFFAKPVVRTCDTTVPKAAVPRIVAPKTTTPKAGVVAGTKTGKSTPPRASGQIARKDAAPVAATKPVSAAKPVPKVRKNSAKAMAAASAARPEAKPAMKSRRAPSAPPAMPGSVGPKGSDI